MLKLRVKGKFISSLKLNTKKVKETKVEDIFAKATDLSYRGEHHKAELMYLNAANNGHSESQNIMGNICLRKLNNIDKKTDTHQRENIIKEAISWYEKASEQNNILAKKTLSLMYQDGLGVEMNLEKADQLIHEIENLSEEELSINSFRM